MDKINTLDLDYITGLFTAKIPFSVKYDNDKAVITVDDEFGIESKSILYSIEKNQSIEELFNIIESNEIFKVFSVKVAVKSIFERLNIDELKSLYNFTEFMIKNIKFRKFVKYINIHIDNKRTDNTERNNLLFEFIIIKQVKKIDSYESLFNIFLDELIRIRADYDDNGILNFLRFDIKLES